MQNTADRKDSILKTDITEPITDHLLSFFQGEESLDSFNQKPMSENTDKKLQQIIDLEIRELYDLAFFKPYLVNYIADFKPQFHQSMSDREYRDYLERKNEEAIQEFCRSIKADCPRNEAITNALHVLLSDLL